MTLSPADFPTDARGWASFLPPHKPAPELRESMRVPWTVVGVGFTGLACARKLAELHPGQEILLVDARQVGQGASGRNSGYAVSLSHFPGMFQEGERSEYQRINRINAQGLAILREQIQTLGIACQWQEEGIYHTAADKTSLKECENFERYLSELELPHTPLGRDDLEAKLGTSHYLKGIHVNGGALLQPAATVRGLTLTLPENVTLHEQTPVISINQGSPIKLDTPHATIETDKLILATNYEAPQIGFLRGRILGSTLSGSFTRVLTDEEFATLGNVDAWGILSLHGGGATVRLTQDRRICIRNTAEYFQGNLLSNAALKDRQQIHRQGFEARFPKLAHVPFEHSWSGVEGISRNGTNFFGEKSKNIFFAGGYNGSGVSRGTAFGTALAEYASGQTSPLTRDCLASPAASWVPPSPIRDFGAWLTVRNRFKGVGRDL